MTDVRFYHLTSSPIEQALPDLLDKTLSRGWRAVVRLHEASQAESFCASLWTYRKESFLPHGSAKDGFAQRQPIWLTHEDENPNAAQVLFLINGAGTDMAGSFDLACELFDGNDRACVEEARQRWVRYKAAGMSLTYWQQGENGWTKNGE